MALLDPFETMIRNVKVELGLDGMNSRMVSILEQMEKLEDELCERRLRWVEQIKLTEMEFYRKLNEGVMKALAKSIVMYRHELRTITTRMDEIYGESKQVKASNNEITEAMIQIARNYPVDRIVQVEKGYCKCPSGNHADNKPSAYTKNNFVYCFSCQWSGDAISLYMAINSVDFVQAVKSLQ